MKEPQWSVSLEELNEDNLYLLLEAAVADADPLEVMTPVDGPPGWTPLRRRSFIEFHRGRALHPTRPTERTFTITLDGKVIGATRLEPHGDDVEAGIWIGRSYRNHGIGRIVITQLRILAVESGAHHITASTTLGNTAARRLIDTALRARAHIDNDKVLGISDLE
ncbi:GNAT family N-acetyltransferase [Nocardia sp. NBC_01329]|uniref:GNAT family N-acetyltransferase n=1 Tax=Nocardia sp. NBC_01329 TaxID=2903594 RepID=UPI002E11B9DF|nr:GNAT family N-acetyltransferase [Nocardia sp. NBC_01329]